jgi:hypothetical protein
MTFLTKIFAKVSSLFENTQSNEVAVETVDLSRQEIPGPQKACPWLISLQVHHKSMGVGTIVETFLRKETVYCKINFEDDTKEFLADLLNGWGGYFQDISREIEKRQSDYLKKHALFYQLEAEKERNKQQLQRDDERNNRRSRYLTSIGKTDPGFKSGATSNLRVTHCWSCHSHLENSIHLECSACNWIVCPKCGACGCGYS